MSQIPSSPNQPKRRVYGRRLGRPLSETRKKALTELLPVLEIPLSETDKETIDPVTLFQKGVTSVGLEIGFGNGEHLKALMERHPDRGWIGVEPYIGGMSAFLVSIRDMSQDNVRVLMDDAVLLLDRLPDNSLETIYILNPDPWPKKRHHERRMVRPDNLDRFARVLKSGGTLTFTTDVDDLADWMVTYATNHPDFEWMAERADDWRTRPEDWIPTRYEEKGIAAGRKQSYFLFRRR